jgi:hypothetical protein
MWELWIDILAREYGFAGWQDLRTADYDAVRACLPGADAAAVMQAFLTACGFDHRAIAALLLDRCIELDPALGERVEKWRGRSGFVAYLSEHPQRSGNPWLAVVLNELHAAMHISDLEEFNRERPSDPSVDSDLACAR